MYKAFSIHGYYGLFKIPQSCLLFSAVVGGDFVLVIALL